jgi:hypothetical protein
MNALPVGELVHRLPSRMRIRVADRKGNVEFFQRLQRGMTAVPLVGEVRSSPITATLVLEGVRIEPAELATVARERRWFDLREPLPSADRPHDWLDDLARSPELPRAVAGVLIALALLQVGRGIVLPPAVTLAWDALVALRGGIRE